MAQINRRNVSTIRSDIVSLDAIPPVDMSIQGTTSLPIPIVLANVGAASKKRGVRVELFAAPQVVNVTYPRRKRK